jgi:WD40 repeat protein
VLSASGDGTARIWDPSTTAELLVIETGVRKYVPFSSWSPSGDRFILTSESGKATIFDAATGAELHALSVPGYDGTTIPAWLPFTIPAWSPDGSLIAIGYAYDASIRLWDADSGVEKKFLYSYTSDRSDWFGGNYIHLLEWSPSGDKILSSAYRTYEPLRVWDVTTGEMLLPNLAMDTIVASWSPDGRRIATYSFQGTGNIWDAETGGKLLEFSGHSGRVTGLTWSPTGERIATSGLDGMVIVRDAHSGWEVLLYPIGAAVDSVDWSPDGTKLLISYAGKSVILPVWNTTQELIDYAKACCVVRELSPEDRSLYGLPPVN